MHAITSRLSFEWYEANGRTMEAVNVAGTPHVAYGGSNILDIFERALHLIPDGQAARARILNNLAYHYSDILAL